MKVEVKQQCYNDTVTRLKEKYGSDAITVGTPDGRGEISLRVYGIEMKYLLNPDADVLILNAKIPVGSFSEDEAKEMHKKLRVKYQSLYPRLKSDHIALRETCFCMTDSVEDQGKMKDAPFSFIEKLEEIHQMFFGDSAGKEARSQAFNKEETQPSPPDEEDEFSGLLELDDDISGEDMEKPAITGEKQEIPDGGLGTDNGWEPDEFDSPEEQEREEEAAKQEIEQETETRTPEQEPVDGSALKTRVASIKEGNPAMASEIEVTIAEMNALFKRQEQQLDVRRNSLDEYAKFLEQREAELKSQKENLQADNLAELEEIRSQQEARSQERDRMLSLREKEIEQAKVSLEEEKKQVETIRTALEMRRTKLDAEQRSLEEWKKDIEEQAVLAKKMNIENCHEEFPKELPSITGSLNSDFFQKFYTRLEKMVFKTKPIEQKIDQKLDTMMELMKQKSVIELPSENAEEVQELQEKLQRLKTKLQTLIEENGQLEEKNGRLEDENWELQKEKDEWYRRNGNAPAAFNVAAWKKIINTDLISNGLELKEQEVEGKVIFSGKQENCDINFNLDNQILCVTKHVRWPVKYIKQLDQLNSTNPFPDCRLVTYEISKDGLRVKALVDGGNKGISTLLTQILASIAKIK